MKEAINFHKYALPIFTLICILIWLTACSGPKHGDIKQKNVYERCIERDTSVGITTNGDLAMSNDCIKKQRVFITEKYEYNSWKIIKVELVE